MRHATPPDRFDVLLHVGGFVVVGFVLWILIPGFFPSANPVTRSVAATLISGLIANLACARWFGQRRFSDFGMGWNRSAALQLLTGLAIGGGTFGLLVLGAVFSGMAQVEPGESGNVAVVFLLLLGGAVGEELLFRGYAFQFLARTWTVSTIIGSGVLFGLAHLLLNQNIDAIGAVNTALWGALLGFAVVRTRALWLPIGIHLSWNLAQVLSGASLSGTTIRATGIRLHWAAAPLWSGGDYGPEGGLLTTFAGAAVYLMLRRVR